MLQTGGAKVNVLLREPRTLPPTIPSYTEDRNRSLELYNVSMMSTTTPGISTITSDPAQASTLNQETGNVTPREEQVRYALSPRIIVGPVMYMYFSAANTSDAGFTVDLLFQHPDYLKASLFSSDLKHIGMLLINNNWTDWIPVLITLCPSSGQFYLNNQFFWLSRQLRNSCVISLKWPSMVVRLHQQSSWSDR